MMRYLWIPLSLATLLACRASEPSLETITAETREKLTAGDDQALHAMGWRSLRGGIELIDDPAAGEAATTYVERCTGLWGAMPGMIGEVPEQPAARKAYWLSWYGARERSIRGYRQFNCKPEMKPDNVLVAESSRPAP